MINAEIRAAIDTANKRFMEGFVKIDDSITASGFADDAVIFPPDANMIQGKKAIEAFWKSVMDAGVKEVKLITVELSASGDYAVERGTGVLTIRPPSGAPAEQNITLLYGKVRRTAGRICGTSGTAPPNVKSHLCYLASSYLR